MLHLLPRLPSTLLRLPLAPQTRCIASTSSLLAGHSKWSKIKHDKGKADKRKSLEFARYAAEISNATKDANGDMTNQRLLLAMSAAKKAGMPKTRIDSAISRGLGVSTSGAPLEPLTLEAIFHSAALVVDVMTENRLRALQDLKFILTKAGAQVTPSSYLFTRNGVILVKGDKDKVDADKVLEMALEIEGEGVREVEEEEGEEGEVLVLTDPAEITRVAGELRERVPEGVEVMSKGMEWVPNEDTMVGGLGERGEELERVVGALEEYQDVVGVYTNVREEE